MDRRHFILTAATLVAIEAAKAGTFSDSFQRCLDGKDLCRRPGQLGGRHLHLSPA